MAHTHFSFYEPLPRDARVVLYITMALTVLCALGYSYMAYGAETKPLQTTTIYHAVKPVPNDTRVGVKMRAPGTDLQGIPSPRKTSQPSEPVSTNEQERRPPTDGLSDRKH